MSDKGLTVKEFDPELQPREKAIQHGIATLSTSELWAIILRVGSVGYPITTLCRDLMRSVGDSMLQLERTSRERLLHTNGIGMTKAIQIEAVMELTKRYHKEAIGGNKRYQIKDSRSIYEYMLSVNMNSDSEEIWILLLNNGNRILSCRKVSEGGGKATVFDLKKILRMAIELPGCEAIVMCHNHPSGTLRPSIPDDNITKNLCEGAKVIDLKVLDHLIISSEGYYSYYDNGRLN